jgi:hypothetical protein
MNITLDNMSNVYKAGKSSIDTMQLKGYELIENVMVDNSGFGADDEYADTPKQFNRRLHVLLEQYGKLTAKITDVGQFQVYVGLFKKTGKSQAKKIANNTLRIDDGNGNYRIRLHDTDIITFKNGKYILDNGGYATRTTHARMNEFTPFMVSAKNYQTIVNGKPLVNGQTIR